MLSSREHKKSKNKQDNTTELMTTHCVKEELDLINAARNGDLETIQRLCKNNVNINFHAPAQESSKFNKLFKNIKSKISSPFTVYDTALSIAIDLGHNTIAAYLLEQGAKIEQGALFTCNFNNKDGYNITRTRYTDNLIGLGCFGPINHSVFTMLLRRAEDIFPTVYTKNGRTRTHLLDYLLSENDLPKDDTKTRSALLICEAILRNETLLLDVVSKNHCEKLTADMLKNYLLNIPFTEEHSKLATQSIQYLVKQKVISTNCGEELNQTLITHTKNSYPIPSIATALLSTSSEKIDSGEQHEDMKQQNQILVSEVANLAKQNQELRQEILELTKRQERMEAQLEILMRNHTNRKSEDGSDSSPKKPGFFSK